MLRPRLTHHLDQLLALNLDVQARLKGHERSLIAAGWSKAEAWALCQRVEERILGPAMDLAESVERLEEHLEEIRKGAETRMEAEIRAAIAERLPKP